MLRILQKTPTAGVVIIAEKLYKPFYYMFLMGLHSTVQMLKYLYRGMVTALE